MCLVHVNVLTVLTVLISRSNLFEGIKSSSLELKDQQWRINASKVANCGEREKSARRLQMLKLIQLLGPLCKPMSPPVSSTGARLTTGWEYGLKTERLMFQKPLSFLVEV